MSCYLTFPVFLVMLMLAQTYWTCPNPPLFAVVFLSILTSGAKMLFMCCNTLQHVEFIAYHGSWFGGGTPHTRRTSSYVASCEGPGVIPGGTTGRWNNVAMFIPAIAPSRLAGCNIINLSYVLKVHWMFTFLAFLYSYFFIVLQFVTGADKTFSGRFVSRISPIYVFILWQ